MFRTVRFLLPLLAATACSGNGGDSTPVIPRDTADSAARDTSTGDSSTTAPSCGAADLCARSIDECAVDMSQEECEGWYANSGNCADMDAYTSCNCGCITQPACDSYFACGQACFNDYC